VPRIGADITRAISDIAHAGESVSLHDVRQVGGGRVQVWRYERPD
jgi:hypothetical protein